MWISERECSRRLQVGKFRFRQIAEAARIRTRKLPGIKHPQFSSEDVDRVVRESIVEPGQVEKAEVAR